MNFKNYRKLIALGSLCLTTLAAKAVAPGPYEILPFADGFIQEAYVDLLAGSGIADWTGWSGSSFISPNAYNTHIGTDFSMQTGTPLYAAAAGTVIATYSGYPANDHSDPYYGNYVKIAVDGLAPNGEAINLIYGHMLSTSVSVGQRVNVGDQVGLSDNTGLSDSEHLHFESDLRSSGAATCPLYWAHFKYPIMFNPAGTHQLGRVVKVTAASTAIRNGRFDSSTQIGTAWQNQLYFCSYPKRGYYHVFIPNNTSYRSGWLRATDVEEVFTGTVIQALPDNGTYVHLGQLAAKYPIRATASDSAAQIGEIVFGGGRFVADQTSNGYYRIPVPGASATWGWVKPTSRMVVYPQLTNPNINLANLPNNDFPITENFTATGKSMFGRPKFNRSTVKAFSPAAPGGDGKALFITDKTNYGTGTCESVTVGKPGHRNYYVQCAVYFSYQPSYLGSGQWERYGIYLRDDGFAGLDTTYEGAGNGYALLWDNDDGRLRAGKLVEGVITDFLPTATYVTGSGWHTLRLEANGTSIKYYLDGNLLINATDSTFHSGQCGIGYSSHTGGSNPAARGAYFDNFIADSLDPVLPVITAQPASTTRDPGQTATFTVAATGATTYQWQKNGVNLAGKTTATLTLANVQLADAGFYTVVVGNAAGTVTSSAAQLVVTASGSGAGTGTGLRGCYYDNPDFSALRLSRLDGPVNFDWGTGAPAGSMGVDTFSVRWTGQVQPRYSQTYTFYTTTDDGVRLWVNGVLLIDYWAGQAATERSGSIALVAGQKYDLRLEYYENTGSAVAQLRWSSASQLKELIPAAQLYRPAPELAAVGAQTVAENSLLSVPLTLVAWDQIAAVTPIEDFESYGDGAPTDQIMFRKPGMSSSTSGFLDGAVTNYNVPTGSFPGGNLSARAMRVYWSFQAGTTNPWLRLTTYNAATRPNPIVDITRSLWFDLHTDKALQVGLGLRETNPTGAIGEDGGGSGPIEFVGVSGVLGTAPVPERTVSAGSWTTLKFDLPREAVTSFTGNGVLESTTGKAVLESLALVPAGGLGVYNVYLDNFVQVQPAVLSYALEPGAPAGAAIDANTGVFTWQPAVGQGPGTYTITVRVRDLGTPEVSGTTSFTVTVKAAPVITGQPQSLGVGVGSNATFTVTATGTAPLYYQWRKDGSAIGGATGSSYTRVGVQLADAGFYSVVVSNAVGSVESAAAELSVWAVETPPVIVTPPQSQTVVAGTNVVFSVVATGTAPLWYQWYRDGNPLAGATQSQYAKASVQVTDAGSYMVVVSNQVGSISSDSALLIVLEPPVIVTPPQSQAVVAGTNVAFSVVAAGTAPLWYQWYRDGNPLAGATQSQYAKASVQVADAGSYTVVVSNQVGSVTSGAAVLTVYAPPEILVHPVSQAVAAGSEASFSVSAGGSPPLSYQWQLNGTAVAGATDSRYTVSAVQAADVGMYSVEVSNPYGSVTSLAAALTLTGAVVFQDDFETCDLAGWTVAGGSATELEGSSAQNHTAGGGCSARVDHSRDKMYHNLGVEVGGRLRAGWWIYDGEQSRIFGEVRAYAGPGYTESGQLQQLLAAGKYNSVTLGGEVWDSSKYQGRVSYGANVGWFNLNAPGAPGRSPGWHLFEIERLGDGTTVNFYVDGILGRTILGAAEATIDTLLIGSVASGSTTGEGWLDDVRVEYLDAPVIVTPPAGQTVAVGEAATLSVVAGNTVLSYQWYLNGVAVAGATGATLTIPQAQASDAGSYTVVVGNGLGEVTGGPAELVVTSPSEVRITGAELGAGTLTLRWDAQVGQTYRVQYKNNLTDAVWTDGAEVTATAVTASAVCSLADGAGVVPRRFFRIMVVN